MYNMRSFVLSVNNIKDILGILDIYSIRNEHLETDKASVG